MPGLFGFVQNRERSAAVPLLERMADALEPETRFKRAFHTEDGFGAGRASLAIGDTSRQPVWNAGQTVMLMMEGELYDRPAQYARLAKAGDTQPPAGSDAELMLRLFEQFGRAFVDTLNGQFLVLIWDTLQHALLIANDRLGLYPLYYSQTSAGLVFASGVRALLMDAQVSREVDRVAIQEYLTFDHILGQRTLLANVHLLPQGSLLSFSADEGLSIRPYYDLHYETAYSLRSEADYFDELLALLRQAAQRQAPGGLPAGLMLSGGLDSRMLLALFAEQGAETALQTFTWSIPGSFDARYAAEAARKAGQSHHFFELKPDWLLESSEKAVRITDGMGNLVNLHALATLEQEADYASLIYKGFMGDAMFGFGLRPRFWSLYDQKTKFEVHLEAYRDYNVLSFDLPEHARIFTPEFLQAVDGGLRSDYEAGILACNSPDMADQRCYFDLYQRVPRMTLNGVQVVRDRALVRLPFCDNDLVEFSARTPPFLRFERRIMDDAFIRAFPHLARIPLTNTNLPMVSCAREVWMRNVQFVQWHLRNRGLGRLAGPAGRPYKDYNTWFRTILRPWVEQTLLSPRSLERGYLRPEAIRKVVEDHMAGKNQAVRLGELMSIELWHRMALD